MLPSDEPQHKLQRGLMEYGFKITLNDSWTRLPTVGSGKVTETSVSDSSPWQPQVHDGGFKRAANVSVISILDPQCTFCSHSTHISETGGVIFFSLNWATVLVDSV